MRSYSYTTVPVGSAGPGATCPRLLASRVRRVRRQERERYSIPHAIRWGMGDPDKASAAARGMPVRLANLAIGVARAARLASYYAAQLASNQMDGDLRQSLQRAIAQVTEREASYLAVAQTWWARPAAERASQLAKEARKAGGLEGYGQPYGGDDDDAWGAGGDPHARLARQLAKLAKVEPQRARSEPTVEPTDRPDHTCGPRRDGETWKSYGQRNGRHCPACRWETDALTPAQVELSPAWDGLQADRVASRGRYPSIGGLGSARVS